MAQRGGQIVFDPKTVYHYLGMEIERDLDLGITRISQKRYVRELIARFKMEDANPVATTSEKDIAFSINRVSQFSSNPGWRHWLAAKRILRYLKGTIDLELTYLRDAGSLQGFADADSGGDLDTRRSTSGFVFLMNGGAITWGSLKQKSVALSRSEAEYMSFCQATKEAIWIRNLMSEWSFQLPAVDISSDNQGCIFISKNGGLCRRAKHIDLQYYFVKEAIDDEKVSIRYCQTKRMTADVMTKPLTRELHVIHTESMGIRIFSEGEFVKVNSEAPKPPCRRVKRINGGQTALEPNGLSRSAEGAADVDDPGDDYLGIIRMSKDDCIKSSCKAKSESVARTK